MGIWLRTIISTLLKVLGFWTGLRTGKFTYWLEDFKDCRIALDLGGYAKGGGGALN